MEGMQEQQPQPSLNKTTEPDSVVQAPKKKTNSPVLFTLFLVFLGFCLSAAVFALLSKAGSKKNPTKESPKVTPALPAPTPQVVAESPAPSSVEDEGQSLSPSQKPLPSLTLTGILFGEQGSFALINGKVVPEGGMVSGAKVEKISSDTAELSYDGRRIILKAR